MRFFNKKVRFIGTFIIVLTLLFQTGLLQNLIAPRTALAVGDLTVSWEGAGVGNVGPIFNMQDIAPGDSVQKTITVTNGAPTQLPIGIKAVLTSAPSILSDALNIRISRNGTDLYGGTLGTKTLSDFLADSTNPEGVFLMNQNSNTISEHLVTVTFDEDSGNEYQDRTITFTLKIGVSIDLPVACESIDFGGRDPIVGTARGETLNGTAQNDIIMALGGTDRVDGRGGADCILGGAGSDQLVGGLGADVVLGEDGTDSLFGGAGIDLLFGGEGTDSLTGDDGADILRGENGTDTLNGGNDADTLYGGNGTDSLRGNNGNDYLNGDLGRDSANGGNGQDTCISESRTQCEI